MTKDKIKNSLDFIPLIILTVYAIILSWTVVSLDRGFLWKHIVGLFFLPINYFLFWWRHKVGVIGLGLTLLIGLIGLLSYNHSISITKYWIGSGDTSIPIFYGQPIFLLWLLIHFIVSGRHYVGIVTKKYWLELFDKSFTKTSG
ncbi:MAG TPA: hypothetical protein PLA68_13770 [Panacibacter sp.]|nr:hypothetical protein [Panacibacter sp.]